jgi:hypothetical protein
MSLNLDFSYVFSTASTLVSSLFQAYAIPLGIGLALGILGIITAAFGKLWSRG